MALLLEMADGFAETGCDVRGTGSAEVIEVRVTREEINASDGRSCDLYGRDDSA